MAEYGLLIVYGIILLAGIIYAFTISPPNMQQQQMDPRSDLMVTSTAEGIVVPVVYGTVRLAGNIMYYGGMVSRAHMVEVEGGKGGGGPDAVQSGYDYWLNVWEGICMGPVEILETYVGDNKNKTIKCSETTWNDGTGTDFPYWVAGEKYSGIFKELDDTDRDGDVDNDDDKVEHRVIWSYDLGSIRITPGTFSMQSFKLDPPFSINYVQCIDDGNGHITTPAGVRMEGSYLNYETGILTLTWNAFGGWYKYLFGTDPNAPFAASPLPGMAHIAWEQWELGTEAYNVPNVTFVVKRTLPTTINYANMTNGANPAAVIYDIMTNATYGIGMLPTELNISAFNAAAAVWYTKGYGINMSLNIQNEAQGLIEQILGQVGGSFYIDNDGKFAIYAYSEEDEAVATIDETDFIDFSIERQSWANTYNDVRVKYTDAGCDFVSKTIALFDNANYQVQDTPNQVSIDLSCFTDPTTVSKRAWEFLKLLSYPVLKLKFKLNETHSYPIFAGAVVNISHSDYAISNAKFRITSMSIGEADSLEVEYGAEQMVEEIFDSEYGTITPTINYWEAPDYTSLKLPHSRILELPWNTVTKTDPYYLFLGARAGFETVCYNLKSIVSGTTDFEVIDQYRMFSQYGTLDIAYPLETYAIDDEIGIIYTPYRNDPDPSDLGRASLFDTTRLVIIDNEIMAFQYQLPYGTGSSYQLTGVIRGLFHTTIAVHSVGAPIWIVYPEYCMMKISDIAPFWIKMLPGTKSESVDPALATAIAVTPTKLATVVQPPYAIRAIRNGDNLLTITWFPCVREYVGAGFKAETISTDTWPFEFDGMFEYAFGSNDPTATTVCEMSLTYIYPVVFKVRHKIQDNYSAWATLNIGYGIGEWWTELGGIGY